MYRSKAEIIFAEYLSDAGLKFDNNLNSLPGTPDIVFQRERCCIFFNGCYWHSHGCAPRYFSKTILSRKKHEMNEIRKKDIRNYELLRAMGYVVHVVWDCEFKKDRERVLSSINSRLSLAKLKGGHLQQTLPHVG